MIRKLFITLAIFCGISFISKAQTDFVLSLTMPETDDLIYDAHELPDGSFLFAGKTADNSGKVKPIMIKTDNNGSIQFVRSYDMPGYFCTFVNNNEKLYIVGGGYADYINTDTSRMFISELDNNCDTAGLIYYNMPDSLSLNMIKCLVNSSNDFIYSGWLVGKSSEHKSYSYLLETDKNKEIKKFKVFDRRVGLIGDLIESRQDNEYYAFFWEVAFKQQKAYGDNKILCLDSNFNTNWSSYFPMSYKNTMTVKWISNTAFIFACEEFIDSMEYHNRGIGAMIFSPRDTTIIKSTYIGVNDTVLYPALMKNTVIDDSNNIFIGGIKNFDPQNTFWSTNKAWFCLSKFDKQMNPIWTKYYGGDVYYNLWTIKETQDGGCLMLGMRYDYLTQGYEHDIYIVRVDGNGLVTSTNDIPPLTVSEAIVYPNPGSTQLTIETALKDLQFELYSTNGQTVVSQPVNNGTTTVNTSALPAGVYLYRFMNKEKIVESGKWVKE